ncbi:hypothetical protein ABZV14_07375 [Streptosporangium canum]|uniref:hypothetical protein n=1 Tax=Streptosporangium canum TaxID=324952 RepID=UPI0033AC5E0A
MTFPIQEGRPIQGRLITDPDTSKVLTFEVTEMPQPPWPAVRRAGSRGCCERAAVL